MLKLWSIFWKDTILRFSSKSEMLFFLILPVIFTFILAGGTGAQTDNRIRLLVADQAETPLSRQIITELEKSNTVRPEVVSVDFAIDQFEGRRAAAILIIPEDCDTATLQAGGVTLDLRQQPNNLNAQAAERAVQAVLYRLGSAVNIARDAVEEYERFQTFSSTAAQQAYFDNALEMAQTLMDDVPVRYQAVLGATADPIDYDPASNSSAGQLITWVFIPLIGISASFAYERQRGTLRRLLTSPTGKGTFLLGSILGNMLWALVQMTLLVGFGVLVMNVNWARDPAALAVMMVVSTLAAASLGTMLGAFVKTEGQANGLSIMLGMVMALLGGCWYPIELFPAAVRSAVQIFPTTWAMQGMLGVIQRGQGVTGILTEVGLLIGFAAIFFTIGILRFRYE